MIRGPKVTTLLFASFGLVVYLSMHESTTEVQSYKRHLYRSGLGFKMLDVHALAETLLACHKRATSTNHITPCDIIIINYSNHPQSRVGQFL